MVPGHPWGKKGAALLHVFPSFLQKLPSALLPIPFRGVPSLATPGELRCRVTTCFSLGNFAKKPNFQKKSFPPHPLCNRGSGGARGGVSEGPGVLGGVTGGVPQVSLSRHPKPTRLSSLGVFPGTTPGVLGFPHESQSDATEAPREVPGVTGFPRMRNRRDRGP
jgi:hypothetical protein